MLIRYQDLEPREYNRRHDNPNAATNILIHTDPQIKLAIYELKNFVKSHSQKKKIAYKGARKRLSNRV
ncbi:hypothetical protein HanRHA438_Chr06g0273281 [Helianthus annuus]|nr:hypothetical protein HanIR_Chr06g0283901 [Helianthus annuus]KAJ0912352.1 hypothetical protein HanRHA438_Chr06g0273281 [Helianthus annuus]